MSRQPPVSQNPIQWYVDNLSFSFEKSTHESLFVYQSVTTGSGSFSGKEFLDTVTIAPGLVVHNQAICVSSSSDGFEGVDGILGYVVWYSQHIMIWLTKFFGIYMLQSVLAQQISLSTL